MNKILNQLIMLYIVQSVSAQTFWDQKQLDTFNMDNSLYTVIITSVDDPKYTPILDLSKLKTRHTYGNLILKKTQLTSLDFERDLNIYTATIQIVNNEKLKYIKGLRNIVGLGVLYIDSNTALESLEITMDSIDGVRGFMINNNPILKEIKIVSNRPYNGLNWINDLSDFGHYLEVKNNNSLKKFTYLAEHIENSTLTDIDIENNASLDSIVINKFNSYLTSIVKSQDSLGSKFYLKIIAPVGLGTPYKHIGVRLTIADNSSLTYIGGGFENNPYSLITFNVFNNPKLKNLCMFKQKILDFPDPQSNMNTLYTVRQNDIGAESIEAIKANKCGASSLINEGKTMQDVAIEISPNPTINELNIHNKIGKKIMLGIYNLQGQKISMFSIERNETIDVSNYPEGLYILKTEDKDLKWTEKFIVQHSK